MTEAPTPLLRPQLLEGTHGIVDALDALGDGLDQDQLEIFGMVCFRAAAFARVYQSAGLFEDASGNALIHRAEQEQAFVIRRMLVHYLRSATTWRADFLAEVDQVESYAEALQSNGGGA